MLSLWQTKFFWLDTLYQPLTESCALLTKLFSLCNRLSDCPHSQNVLMRLIVCKSNLKELQVNQRIAGNWKNWQNELCDFNSCLQITGKRGRARASSRRGERFSTVTIVHYIDLLNFSSLLNTWDKNSWRSVVCIGLTRVFYHFKSPL